MAPKKSSALARLNAAAAAAPTRAPAARPPSSATAPAGSSSSGARPVVVSAADALAAAFGLTAWEYHAYLSPLPGPCAWSRQRNASSGLYAQYKAYLLAAAGKQR